MRITTLVLSYILISFSIAGATQPRQKTAKPIDQLTTVSLPFFGNCGESIRMFDNDGIHTVITDLPGGFRFGGMLKRTDRFAAVILLNDEADVQVHYLATITEAGEIIDKMELFSDVCSEDQYFTGTASYSIDDNLNIVQQANSESYKRDKAGEIIKKSIISKSQKHEYFVDKDGKIKKQGV